MLYLFLISAMLLGGVFVLAYTEAKMRVRFGGLRRRAFERRLLRSMHFVRQKMDAVSYFLQRDVCAKVLHMCTYTALVSVRYVERKLTQFVKKLRRTKKGGKSTYVSNLRMVSRDRRDEEYDEEFREA